MEQQIKKKTEELVELLQHCQEYQDFLEIRKKVEENPDLHRQISAFRKHVFEVQNSNEPLDMYEEQEKLFIHYQEFRKNPLVNDFLRSELRVARIMQKVYAHILNAVDLDLDEVTEGLDV